MSEITAQDPRHAAAPVDHLFGRLAAAVTGRWGRWLTLALWLIAAGVLNVLAPKLADYYDTSGFGIGDQESVRAARVLAAAFPQARGVPALIVVHNPAGLGPADEAAAQQISDWLVSGAHPAGVTAVVSPSTVPQARAQLVSADGTTLEILATLDDALSDRERTSVVEALRAYTDRFDSAGGRQVKVTGPAGIITDAASIFGDTDLPLLLTTVALVLVLLLAIYRSPLLALAPLVAVGAATAVVNPLLGFAARAGLFPVNQQAASILTILLFGAGTDYTIFLAARYREELEREADRFLALRRAVVGVGEAITSSAGTVIVALLTLLLTTLTLYRGLGPTLALGIAVMLVAGLTFVPALLAILGRAAFWPFVPKLHPDTAEQVAASVGRGFWGRIASVVVQRPGLAVAGSVLLLGVLALGNLGTPEVFNFLTGFRKPTPSAAGYAILAAHYPPGALAPSDVIVRLPAGTDAWTHLAAIDQLGAALAGVPNVAQIAGPTRPTSEPVALDPAALQAAIAALPADLKAALRTGRGGPPVGAPSGMVPGGLDPRAIAAYVAATRYISPDGTVVRFVVTLGSDPYGVPALDTIAPLRAAARTATQAAFGSGASVLVGGVTPTQADTRAVSDHDKTIVVPLVLVLTAVILGLLLRSVVAAVYLLAAVTLNYFAALGAASFFFHRVQGDEGIAYAVPLYTFIFLVALGADYTIFLMARVREEAGRYGTRRGTQGALRRTGGVITSAGLILAGTFLVLTTLPLRDLYQLGLTVGLGILLDTFVVRGLLVPGIVVLLGRWNWWPGRLRASATTTAAPPDRRTEGEARWERA
jgi:RND superfamily putative drug exporter